MKKLVVLFACVVGAVMVNAATVGWSLMGASNYAGDAYRFFVVGQNGVESIATVTALLDSGSSVDKYAFGSGTIAAAGSATVTSSTSGKTLGAGTYTAFYVVFDSETPASGSANYAVVSGATGLTKTVAATTAAVTFAAGSAASTLSNTENWKSYGTPSGTPEPTSGLLLVLGGAMLALRRKQK